MSKRLGNRENKINIDKMKPQNKFKFPDWLGYTLAIIGVIITIIIIVKVSRTFSYKMKYKSQVQKQIIEMVKPEALKPEYRKGS